MPRRWLLRAAILTVLLIIAVGGALVAYALTLGLPRPLSASAPQLQQRHLHTIEAELRLRFPAGSTLRHAAIAHGKDALFMAVLTADTASVAEWAGPPADLYQPDLHQTGTLTVFQDVPWSGEVAGRPIQRAWFNGKNAWIELSQPDERGEVIILVTCRNQPASFLRIILKTP